MSMVIPHSSLCEEYLYRVWLNRSKWVNNISPHSKLLGHHWKLFAPVLKSFTPSKPLSILCPLYSVYHERYRERDSQIFPTPFFSLVDISRCASSRLDKHKQAFRLTSAWTKALLVNLLLLPTLLARIFSSTAFCGTPVLEPAYCQSWIASDHALVPFPRRDGWSIWFSLLPSDGSY